MYCHDALTYLLHSNVVSSLVFTISRKKNHQETIQFSISICFKLYHFSKIDDTFLEIVHTGEQTTFERNQ